MDTLNENPQPQPQIPQENKNYYKSIEEIVAEVRVTLENASLPEIAAIMQTAGYTQEKIDGMKTKLDNLIQLMQTKTKEDADQVREQDNYNSQKDLIDHIFVKHRKMARILLTHNPHAQVSLQLSGIVPRTYADWKNMVTNFYNQILNQPDLQTVLQTINISNETVQAQIDSLATLETLRASLKKETAEALVATDIRNKAFDELMVDYRTYIKYAKVLLSDNRLRKAIGIM